MFAAYRRYVDGYLPEAGGVTDQPNNMMLALDDISLSVKFLDNEDAKSEQDSEPSPSSDGWKSVIKR